MGEKRVIEQIASDEIYNDDWFLKDSVLHDTTKVQPSVIKEYVNQGMATSQDLADEATARQNMDSQLASGIGQQMSNLADFYDTTKSYVVGDVCVLQSGELMRCIAPTSGAFDNTKWEQVTVDELFDDLNFSADAISYDNETSGLEADNVQDAIDEVLETAGKVDDIVSNGQSLVENKIADLSSLTAVGTASGDIATFPDGSDLSMPKLEVAIEPQQDLHGYDAPWVGGAGKNLLNVAKTYTFTGIATIDLEQPIPSGTTIHFKEKSHSYATEPSVGEKTIYLRFTNPNTSYSTGGGVTSSDRTITLTDSVTRVLIYSNGYNYDASVGVTVTVEELMISKETITEWSPYSNICPIIGWDECNVGISGFNVWDEEWELGSFNFSTGEKTPNNTMIRSKNPIPIKGNTQYFTLFSHSSVVSGFAIPLFYDNNGDYISYVNVKSNGDIITTPSNANYMMFTVSSLYGTTYNNDISINYPSTDTNYHAYNGTTYEINLGDTRYGGTLDVVSGVLTVDRVGVDLGDFTWNGSLSAYHYYTTLSIPYKWANNTKFICSKYKFDGRGTGGNYYGVSGTFRYWYSESGNPTYEIYVCDETHTFSSFTEVKEYLSGTTLVYELATPLTIQLTPTVVKSLRGMNNLYADTGAILDAEYIRDLTTIIDYILEQLGN